VALQDLAHKQQADTLPALLGGEDGRRQLFCGHGTQPIARVGDGQVHALRLMLHGQLDAARS
jgi:hypothetical protein